MPLQLALEPLEDQSGTPGVKTEPVVLLFMAGVAIGRYPRSMVSNPCLRGTMFVAGAACRNLWTAALQRLKVVSSDKMGEEQQETKPGTLLS